MLGADMLGHCGAGGHGQQNADGDDGGDEDVADPTATNGMRTEADYRARIDTLIERMHDAPLAEGSCEVLVPGEPEDRIEAERRRKGIPYSPSEVAALQDEAKRAAIQPLVLSDRPIGT